MKSKILIIAIFLFTITLKAQTKFWGASKIKIGTIPAVTAVDSILVPSATGLVQHITYSNFFAKMHQDLLDAGLGGGSSLTFTSPLSETGYVVSMTQAGAAQNGWLSSVDYTTFNNKVSFPGFTNLFTDYGFIDNSANWNTAFGWGDHANVGYLPKSAGNTQQLSGALYGGNFVEVTDKNRGYYIYEDKLMFMTEYYSSETWFNGQAIGIGTNSLQQNTGNYTYAIGLQSGQYNEGSNSLFVGFNAGRNNKGSSSYGIGSSALLNNIGSGNIGIGGNSSAYSTGINNVGIGLDTNKDQGGNYNVSIGYNAASTSIAYDYTVTIGSYALPTQDHQVMLGGNLITSVRVGNTSYVPLDDMDLTPKKYVDDNAGLSNIVDDTTPQLGGDLDGNDHVLTITDDASSNTDIIIGNGKVESKIQEAGVWINPVHTVTNSLGAIINQIGVAGIGDSFDYGFIGNAYNNFSLKWDANNLYLGGNLNLNGNSIGDDVTPNMLITATSPSYPTTIHTISAPNNVSGHILNDDGTLHENGSQVVNISAAENLYKPFRYDSEKTLNWSYASTSEQNNKMFDYKHATNDGTVTINSGVAERVAYFMQTGDSQIIFSEGSGVTFTFITSTTTPKTKEKGAMVAVMWITATDVRIVGNLEIN